MLMRDYVRLIVEVDCLTLILDKAEILGYVPEKWREQMDDHRNRPYLLAYSKSLENMIAAFETVADETEMLELLQKISQGKPTN